MKEYDCGETIDCEGRFDIDLERLMSAPRHFPLRLSLQDDALIFVEADAADYRRASFLDPRGFPTRARGSGKPLCPTL